MKIQDRENGSCNNAVSIQNLSVELRTQWALKTEPKPMRFLFCVPIKLILIQPRTAQGMGVAQRCGQTYSLLWHNSAEDVC